MRSPVRLLDANANRAREAMRVMEDTARFILDDAPLACALKNLRHDFAGTVRQLNFVAQGLELHRDTPRDVGTAMSNTAERSRGSARDVAIAAGKRLTEALRCLEEFSKPYPSTASERFKAMRYAAYEIERKLHQRLGSHFARQWRLCVIITESLCEHHDWFDVARAAVDSGADCLQLREKELDDRSLLERVMRLADLVSELPPRKGRFPVSVIVNDRPDVAVMASVGGVHLGQDDAPPALVRSLIGPDRIIGVSTHNLSEARCAVKSGADYCGVGAIFPTATKKRKPSGVAYLKRFIKAFPNMPHLAIGGITPENAAEAVDAGARGLAVSSVVCAARKPARVTRQLIRAMPGS